ncbi:unnamed protein product [Prunus armeniaca]|uniref:Uncharacterized protein n=1 Tax=Prunus armeniaca TaxID=36596 RepID=A0A6J5WME0_PRUAR|nr:unnamed protein product [Prunus armeniaca]
MGNMENNNINTNNNNKQWPLQCEILHNQTENLDKETPFDELHSKAYVRGYSGCRQKTEPAELFPFPSVRRVVSYGGRTHMEDTHICVGDLATKFGYNDELSEEAISFYGVSFFHLLPLYNNSRTIPILLKVFIVNHGYNENENTKKSFLDNF